MSNGAKIIKKGYSEVLSEKKLEELRRIGFFSLFLWQEEKMPTL